MAVDVVSIELLSADQFPVTGKNTGNFGDFGLEIPDRNRRIAPYLRYLSNSILDHTL
jgi:hypothetical protein